jgi:hypothetical protein
MAKQVLTTVIEATNERGVKFGGAWHNYSGYASDGDIDRTVSVGDRAEVELTGTGWVRKLRVLERAAQAQAQPNGAASPSGGAAPAGARQLDAAQYARLRAVELASAAALHYSDSVERYLENLSILANWISRYVEEGDPLG